MMSDLIDQARFQIDRYGHTTKGTSLSLVNTIGRLREEIEQLKAEHEKWDAIASRENEKLQARLDYIGNPQNGSVDLAAYARGD